MGVKYIKLHGHNTCAPVAILNVDKWRGKDVTLRDLPRYKKKCKWHQDGTWIPDISRAIGKPYRRYTYQQFKRIFERGGIAMCSTAYPGHGCEHTYLVTGYERGKFQVINESWIKHTELPWNVMKRYLKRTRVWTVYK